MAEAGDGQGEGAVDTPASPPEAVMEGLSAGLIFGQSKSKAEEFVEFKDLKDSDKNSSMIVCQFCRCKILRPGYGSLEKEEKFLPSMTEKYQIGSDLSGDTVEMCWKIADKFHYENIGFSKTVSGDMKYLICADCEQGPIGWAVLTRQESFIAANRVHYTRT